jgi:hypothetical protein
MSTKDPNDGIDPEIEAENRQRAIEDAPGLARLDQVDAKIRAELGLGHWPIVPD